MGLLAFFHGGGDEEGNSGEKYDRAKEDETSLGNILLEKGYVTQVELEEAIKIQKSQSLLGRILVNMGVITEEQLEEVLLEQKIRRKEARAQDLIKSNSKKHERLVKEVQGQLSSLASKYAEAGEE